ncbi:hypothetical protein Taro_047295 [Colocasia esculenta]|uniref:Phytocyanin domain-containing protein n=1 Tax=Colocasia esculenta TaxID=4460 RepID=A0A843X0K2_COLES|nr:hypothetical protein [Colocasia esculenta]
MAAGSSADAGGASAAAVLPGKRKGMGASSPAWFSFSSCLFLALAGIMATPAAAAVHKVGDAAGWTIIGNVNYTAWAASNTFHVGDTIVFQYNKQFHNVMQVDRADYRACNTQSPLATYTTGNDSIILQRAGHHFFLCGVPGHCAIGQKVDIRIPKRARSAAAPATAPSPASPSSSSSPKSLAPSGGSTGVTAAAAPSPQKSGAAPRVTGWAMVLITVTLAAAAAAATSVEFS